jgi:hypothetical protein
MEVAENLMVCRREHAAAHQICFQLWLASSLLADALAVAAQSLLARRLAAKQPAAGQVGCRAAHPNSDQYLLCNTSCCSFVSI